MKEWTMYVPTILVCIPILMTILFYQVHYRMSKNQWRAIHFTVQFSFVFYIIADTILVNWILHKNLLGIFGILLLILLSIILIIASKQYFHYHPYKDDENRLADIQKRTFNRKALNKVLEQMNKEWDAPVETLEQIERLKDPMSTVVIGGQQAGLLTGPSYTMNKIIT